MLVHMRFLVRFSMLSLSFSYSAFRLSTIMRLTLLIGTFDVVHDIVHVFEFGFILDVEPRAQIDDVIL